MGCVIGIHDQHAGAVTGRRQRHVQRGDGAVLIGARADHDHDRWCVRGRTFCQHLAHLAHGIEEGGQREARPQRRPADPRQVGNPATRQDSAEGPHHVGFLQPCDQWLLDQCDCSLWPRRCFLQRPRRRSRRPRLGFERRFDGIGRQPFGSDNPAGRGQSAEQEAHHRQHAHARRERTALRHGSLTDDARARGVETFLFLGFARALEKRLVDVAACFHVAFEFAKPHRSLAHLDTLALLHLKRVAQRGFKIAGARQVVLGRLCKALDFFIDGSTQVVDLLLHLAQ